MTLEEALARLAISVDLIPLSSSNRPGTKIQPTYVTVHNTDNSSPGANAAMHASYLKCADARQREVSWHFTIDDTQCLQHLPTNEMGWHAGKGNPVSVAIEVCQHAEINQRAAIERAALLAAVLMSELNIPKGRLVTHKHWTGKNCPDEILNRFAGGFDAFAEMAEGYRVGFGDPIVGLLETVTTGPVSAFGESEERRIALGIDHHSGRLGDRIALVEEPLRQREAKECKERD